MTNRASDMLRELADQFDEERVIVDKLLKSLIELYTFVSSGCDQVNIPDKDYHIVTNAAEVIALATGQSDEHN